MSKVKNETGHRYGRLTVQRPYKLVPGEGMYWICRCDCGTEVAVLGHLLRTGGTRSCGCLQREAIAKTGRANKGQKRGRPRKDAKHE